MIIGHGAEAVLYKELEKVIKDRVSKSYRHPALDLDLRKSRTRREAKVLERLEGMEFPAPRLLRKNDKEMKVEFSFIDGSSVKEILESNLNLCSEIASSVHRISQALHPIHNSLKKMILFGKATNALNSQTSAQIPQFVHFFVSINGL